MYICSRNAASFAACSTADCRLSRSRARISFERLSSPAVCPSASPSVLPSSISSSMPAASVLLKAPAPPSFPHRQTKSICYAFPLTFSFFCPIIDIRKETGFLPYSFIAQAGCSFLFLCLLRRTNKAFRLQNVVLQILHETYYTAKCHCFHQKLE